MDRVTGSSAFTCEGRLPDERYPALVDLLANLAMGWRLEDIVVIDCDQGQSGASSSERQGFQQLVAEVSMGRAGVVLGLEVSRLARNNCDWHRLLEICALTDTLVVDEDRIYNPCDFNDRLLMPVDPVRKHHHHKLSQRAPRFRLHGCHSMSNSERRLSSGAPSKR